MATDKMQPEVVWLKFEEHGIRITCLVLRNITQNTDANTNETESLEESITRLHNTTSVQLDMVMAVTASWKIGSLNK